jgi:hypothetical protein
MVANTGLEKLCSIADTAVDMINAIEQLMKDEFTAEMIEERIQLLSQLFDNSKNAATLKSHL